MITLFIVFAMTFFFYAEIVVLTHKTTTLFEKIVSFIVFVVLELYYILQLCERLGL